MCVDKRRHTQARTYTHASAQFAILYFMNNLRTMNSLAVVLEASIRVRNLLITIYMCESQYWLWLSMMNKKPRRIVPTTLHGIWRKKNIAFFFEQLEMVGIFFGLILHSIKLVTICSVFCLHSHFNKLIMRMKCKLKRIM